MPSLSYTKRYLNGSEIIYNDITQPQQKIRVNAKVRGDALVQVFIGTELLKEIEFKGPGA